MVAQSDIITTVKTFASEIINKGIHLKKVYLYGSYSNNTQKEYSDIDVALVADEFTGVGYVDMKLFVSVLRNFILIQPKTYSTIEFETGDPFINEIKRTGLEINVD